MARVPAQCVRASLAAHARRSRNAEKLDEIERELQQRPCARRWL